MNSQNKYIRYALGIPIFCTGIGMWMWDYGDGISFWSHVSIMLDAVILTALALWFLDVPSITRLIHEDKYKYDEQKKIERKD